MKAIAFLFILLGVAQLALGGIAYVQEPEAHKFGVTVVTATNQDMIPISPLAGGLTIGIGAILLSLTRRPKAT